ncbi:MAG TPA: oligosaccharide flippase family protein [Vicinamibacterales bacterium]|nr:oligosaccharide flippase family protein [Vicinamibacterales bacterium]
MAASPQVRAGAQRMSPDAHANAIARPAFLLVVGRAVGMAASFAIGIILARIFTPAEFGTYKQFFLVYATLYGLAQLGMAESLYYFVPRRSDLTGRYVTNALATLALAGGACIVGLAAARTRIAAWLSNAPLADHLVVLGLFLTFMLMSTVLEIVMVSRKRHGLAAVTYAISDIVRTLLFILPALLVGSLRAVFIGATVFAAIRLALMLTALWRQYGRELRLDLALWKDQLAYAVPFALAVGVDAVQLNLHQYVVASQVDAATFAIYAIGCMQIPLLDLIMTSTVNVLMVKMAEEEHDHEVVRTLWHETVCRLALLIVPLAVFLVIMAHDLIVGLFTETYAGSVPIFRVWALMILPTVFASDAFLRAYAQTRYLLIMNVVRLVLVASLIGAFMSAFGLVGAVLVALLAMSVVKGLKVVKIARLMHLGLGEVLPWDRLMGITIRACVAGIPVAWMAHAVTIPPFAGLVVGGALYSAMYAALCYAGRFSLRLATPAPAEVAVSTGK